MGVALADAREVLRVLECSGATLAELLPLRAPWHDLVCSIGQESFDLLGEVAESFFDLPGQGWDIQPREGGREDHRAWADGVDQVRDPMLIA
jgi:hypothetical protein